MTKSFEVISISTTHIYHSALELSPLSSIVRRLYHHRYTTPSPRVIIGPADSWQPSIAIPNKYPPYISCAWSPCGQFIAAQTQDIVEVRDPLTFELLSTLKSTKSTPQLTGPIAYSPDGHSLCCATDTTIVIWDIQTGGLTKEMGFDTILDKASSLVWSLDGETIGAIIRSSCTWSVATCNVASGKTLRDRLISEDEPYLWGCDKSFRVMTTLRDNITCNIAILKVGATLTRVVSFVIRGEALRDVRIGSFSPISHRTSASANGGRDLLVFGDRGQILLSETAVSNSHCFSSDGELFAASLNRGVHVWKLFGDNYIRWRNFPDQSWSVDDLRLQFSPNSSSILGHFIDVLQVWRLDGHHTVPVVDSEQPYVILSPHGTYTITAHQGGTTVTITNLILQTPPQFIDMDTPISGLALTGNVLVVVSSGTIMAWLLTEVGAVKGVPGNRRAGRGDNIWATSQVMVVIPPGFSVGGYVGFIVFGGSRIYYHVWTGERLELTSDFSPSRLYSLKEISRGRYHLPRRDSSPRDDPDDRPVLQTTFLEGWVKDPDGKHRLWLPVEWRAAAGCVEWSRYIPTLQVELPKGGFIAITF